MRILLISLRYPPEVGGSERAAAILAQGLAEAGHLVNVVTGGKVAGHQVDSEGSVQVHRFPLPRGMLPGPCYVARAVRISLRLGRHDVVHAHMASGPAAAALAVGLRWRAPVVVTPPSGAGPAGGNLADVAARLGGRLRVRLLRRFVSVFVAISPDIKRALEKLWGVPSSRINSIPYAVDTRRFFPPDASEKHSLRQKMMPGTGPLYLYVGRLDRIKGVDVLVAAWRAAGEPGTLVVVGDGPERPRLEAESSPSIRFLGATEDPSPWYRAADIFVLPSRREGLSVALLEAVACGLPVVATAVGDTSVLTGTGSVVPPEDVSALAAALAMPPTAPAILEAFAETYGVEAVVRRHVEMYQSLMQRR